MFQVELNYILQNTTCHQNARQVPFPPIKKIFTSLPFYGLLMTHIGYNWGYFIIATEIPSYLNNIQHVSLKIVSNKTLLFVKFGENALMVFNKRNLFDCSRLFHCLPWAGPC